jgi:hypothetical protein
VRTRPRDCQRNRLRLSLPSLNRDHRSSPISRKSVTIARALCSLSQHHTRSVSAVACAAFVELCPLYNSSQFLSEFPKHLHCRFSV